MAASMRFVYVFKSGNLKRINFPEFHKLQYIIGKPAAIHRKHSTKAADSFKYCVDSVRKYDFENYLCCLLLPDSVRRAAFVIRAFNVELSQVRDLVSTAAIGEMRLKFWHDALNSTFVGNPPDQPVAKELSKVLEIHKLSKVWFQRLIISRENILNDKPFLTIKELEEYCDNSVVPVYFLLLQALGIADVQSDHVASHLGKCQGISNLLRGIPYNASKGRVLLPLELMSKHKISQHGLFYGSQKENLQDAVHELSTIAHQHLLMARKLSKDIESSGKPVFLPAVATAAYLESLEKTDFDVFHPKNQRRNNWLPVSLLIHRIRRRY